MRNYECRKDPSGRALFIQEDIKLSALEAILPGDLQRHVQMNRHRLRTYAELRSEIYIIVEDKYGVPGNRRSDPMGHAPMDVDALHKEVINLRAMVTGKGGGKWKHGKNVPPVSAPHDVNYFNYDEIYQNIFQSVKLKIQIFELVEAT